jgi:hypothetical protein
VVENSEKSGSMNKNVSSFLSLPGTEATATVYASRNALVGVNKVMI